MRGRHRVGWVLVMVIAMIGGVVSPGGAVDEKGKITEFPVNGEPQGITAGPDGNLWFTLSSDNVFNQSTGLYTNEYTEGRIGRITPSGVVTEFSSGISEFAELGQVTAGPDGNLWFAVIARIDGGGNLGRIGRITPAGVVTVFSAGISGVPNGITAGPDGNLWFAEDEPDQIGRITPDGVVTEFAAGITPGSYPYGITAGPDGNLWFTEAFQNRDRGAKITPQIGRITPDGVVTEFAAGLGSRESPWGITAGPDGNLWFTNNGDEGGIGRITPEGKVTQFASADVTGITTGCDGNLWFPVHREQGRGIWRITPKGKFTQFATEFAIDITTGPDGNLWFTGLTSDAVSVIARMGTGPVAKSRGRNGPTLPTACPRARR